MQETTKAFINSRKTTDVYTPLKQLFLDSAAANTGIIGKIKSLAGKKPPLTRQCAELGLLLINEVTGYRGERWQHSEKIIYNSKRYNRIVELLGADEWDNADNYALLVTIFGDEKAACVRHAWKRMPYQMYQTGYLRRSFRSPANRAMYLPNQLNLLVHLIPQSHSYETQYTPEYRTIYIFYDFNLAEQMRYAQAVGDTNNSIFMLWCAAIDLGNTTLLTIAEDIIFNRDEEGKVTRSLIKALLNSEKPEAWQLVEKLLLAAQRQEGLRQTILEALDETSIGALKYMIKVIIDNQLARFSSVVRAIDVWAGLGWETERETTVRSFLQKAHEYLENPGEIPAAIASANNMDVYMALWAQGVYDVEKTLPYLRTLCQDGNADKRTLAVWFASITGHYAINMPIFVKALNDTDLAPLACAVNNILYALQPEGNRAYYDEHFPALFDGLHAAFKRVTVKEKTFQNYIFSWLSYKFERKTILTAMLYLVQNRQDRLDILLSYFDDMDAPVKRQLSSQVLPEHTGYHFRPGITKAKPLTAFQRSYAMLVLKDRSEFDVAFKALNDVQFTPQEGEVFPDLLKRKAAGFRSSIIALLMRQQNEVVQPVVDEILLGDPEQRLAGLDILLQLQKGKRLTTEIAQWVKAFSNRKNISQKEEVLLVQLAGGDDKDISAENGYGFFNPANMSAIVKPAIDKNSLYEQLYAQHDYALSMPFKRVKQAFDDLASILTANKEYEYEVELWDKSKETVLLGNSFRRKNNRTTFENKQDEFNNYPLANLWQEWYNKWQLQPQDLLIIRFSFPLGHYGEAKITIDLLPDYKELIPKDFLNYRHYENPFFGIIGALSLVNTYDKHNEFLLGACTRLFAGFTEETLKQKTTDNYIYYSGRRNDGWQGIEGFSRFLLAVDIATLTNDLAKQCWQLFNWRQYAGRPENINVSMPPLLIFCRAYQAGIISEDELFRGLLTKENLDAVSNRKRNNHSFPYFDKYPFLLPMYEKAREYLLDIELKRGDSDTPVTRLVSGLQSIYGINRFTQILVGLGKTALYRGYFYSYSDSGNNKQALFSALLKHSYPLATDTQEQFNESVQKIKASQSRLIEAAVYAPQWQPLISGYLGWKGLDSAIWWMHAHTKTETYNIETAEAESEIAKHSSIDVKDFKIGAVDKDWFAKVYQEIGTERFQTIYDAAKYVSDGNGHRRARIYADVLTGVLTLKAITEKITSKRDQDYLRVFGLVPLSANHKEKDILERYEYLQQFKKESRQFGAQKQTSEGVAIRVAMDNLARNAGYPDPVRLTWAMETKQVLAILAKETQVQYDDVLIGLIVDEEGEADVIAFKDDKQLKAIPAKYKKDVKVLELMEYRKTLREQFKRSRTGLEDAMVRGDVFLYSEIETLFSHPVIAKHLEKLVFIVDNNDGDISSHGFYISGDLKNAMGDVVTLDKEDKLRIAHCADLFNTGHWPEYQRKAFDDKLRQPFKQIFRELYLPTADELKEVTISRRYAGHQVQPKQTAALLRSRGWKADYEEGLQKVFYQHGFVAKLFAMADWFSPAEVEAPTLEIIEFHNLETYKSVPFTEIPGRLFSEVMRDVDLVVSVAHVGGVDAEASHSSIEMRSVLLRETLRLFKITNVEISGSHAKIKGTMGEYSVHLGSAVVHKMGGSYLSILPVHSQHRGRLFLPFVDDDPKSAEVISKVLLLSRDKDIQDPTILSQLS